MVCGIFVPRDAVKAEGRVEFHLQYFFNLLEVITLFLLENNLCYLPYTGLCASHTSPGRFRDRTSPAHLQKNKIRL